MAVIGSGTAAGLDGETAPAQGSAARPFPGRVPRAPFQRSDGRPRPGTARSRTFPVRRSAKRAATSSSAGSPTPRLPATAAWIRCPAQYSSWLCPQLGPGFAGDGPHERIQVTVLPLGSSHRRGQLRLGGGKGGVRAVLLLPGGRLEPLVDVGVHKERPVVAGRVCPESAGTGVDGPARPQRRCPRCGTLQIREVTRGVQLPGAVGNCVVPVGVPAFGPEAPADGGAGDRPDGRPRTRLRWVQRGRPRRSGRPWVR